MGCSADWDVKFYQPGEAGRSSVGQQEHGGCPSPRSPRTPAGTPGAGRPIPTRRPTGRWRRSRARPRVVTASKGHRVRDIRPVFPPQVGQHERDRDRVPGRFRDAEAAGPQHVAPVVAEHLPERVRRPPTGRLELLELGRLVDPEPDQDADHDQRGAEQDDTRQAQVPSRWSLEKNARFASSSPTGKPGCVIPVKIPRLRQGRVRRSSGGATPLGAEGETPHDAHGDQQDQRPDTHLAVGGQAPDEHGRRAREQQRGDQDRLAPDPVAEMAGPTPPSGRTAKPMPSVAKDSRAPPTVGRRRERTRRRRRARLLCRSR